MNTLDYFNYQKENMIKDLKNFVEMETPSDNKKLLDKFIIYLNEYINKNFKCKTEIIKSDKYGNDLKCIINENYNEQILLLCHYDTVFPENTINKHPFKIEDKKAYGPGIFDMKSGLVQTLYALKYLNNKVNKKIVLLITSDEEIDSDFSKGIIIDEAKKSLYTLVMEPSLNGKLKTERSGVGTINFKVYGKASHAGLDPEKGINAIYEMVNIIPEIKKLNDKEKNTSINVTVINGGNKTNVIPDKCEISIDLRYKIPDESDRIINFFKNIKIKNDLNYNIRPPMVKNGKTEELINKIKEIGKKIDINIEDASVAGGSDGNYCSYYCPVIDGLGGVGNGAHSENEYIFIDKLPERSALLYLILSEIQ